MALWPLGYRHPTRRRGAHMASLYSINAISSDHTRAGCLKCPLLAWCEPAGLDSAQTDRLDDLTEHRRPVQRGEFLHRAGAALNSLYMIRTGSTKSCIANADGREQITGFSFPGDLIGVEAIDGGKHLCHVIALEDSTVCGIHRGDFESLSCGIPEMQHHFHGVMSHEITRHSAHMLVLGSMRAEERVALFLLYLSTRFAARGYSLTEFVLPMTREEIGSFLGLKLETVSRVFSSFREGQLIAANSKHIEIRDLNGLRGVIGRKISLAPGSAPPVVCGAQMTAHTRL